MEFIPCEDSLRQLQSFHPESQELVWMSPRDFLILCAGGRHHLYPELMQSALENRDWVYKKSLDYFKEKIRKGECVFVPFLEVDIETCRVVSHEGRHRALAALQLGVEKIPVVLYYFREGRFTDLKYETKRCPTDKLIPQWVPKKKHPRVIRNLRLLRNIVRETMR